MLTTEVIYDTDCIVVFLDFYMLRSLYLFLEELQLLVVLPVYSKLLLMCLFSWK